ncbi:hypothetical protein Cgig2_018863 [Carnegiea gigantea]|uniref:Uncharacterized protein n=1 Tax=Carnegiea gigantea TaxID=171969 RepID=A0A9Q1JN24_9CARY|nr:hypothetical protein Cgig2_018863 [Carnegiea gigantea]
MVAKNKIPQLVKAENANPMSNRCENQCRPRGSESLPIGIVSQRSSLEMRPLWGLPRKRNSSLSLLAMAVGIKQKELVDAIISKFMPCGFNVMLFHYDGVVDEWKVFEWNDKVVHVSAINQTKWWFAKRFLHPDIVAGYEYVFLWDEDIGVEHFDPLRYISIVREEGLEISQPALDGNRSEVHHQITARGRRGNVHRRTYKPGECDDNSTAPPCTGWIEVMAPVFSRPAWRCVWYMIQNDLIHAWGLDIQLGYCAQAYTPTLVILPAAPCFLSSVLRSPPSAVSALGERTKNIGVVDAEYVVHHGLPTLGEPSKKHQLNVLDMRVEVNCTTHSPRSRGCSSSHLGWNTLGWGFQSWKLNISLNMYPQVRRQSYNEYKIFRRRWDRAAAADECWNNPYPEPLKPIAR